MKKLIASISLFFFSLFASEKKKTQRTLDKGNKKLVQVLVNKEKRKKEMIAWLRKATNNGRRYNTSHQLTLLKAKFGKEIEELGLRAGIKNNTVIIRNARY